MKSSIKDINKKLVAIHKISKITKAMQIIATMKFNKFFNKLTTAQLCQNSFQTIFETLLVLIKKEGDHLPLATKTKKPNLWLLFTSDLGFCGFYNGQILQTFLEKAAIDDLVLVVGQKGSQKLKFKQQKLTQSHLSHNFLTDGLEEVITYLVTHFPSQINKCYVIYGQFRNDSSQLQIATKQLLPIVFPSDPSPKKDVGFFFTEGSPLAIYQNSLFLYLKSLLYFYYLNSIVSEERTRQFAMESASKNAKDMIEDLKLKYNQLRQEKITREILDLSQ